VTQSSVWTALRAGSAAADTAPEDDPAAAVPTGPAAASARAIEPPKPEGWSDPLTGMDGPRFWDRILASEEARRRRYRRPVTVVMVEFTGFASDGSWLAQELALQVFIRVARVLAKQVRTSDYKARIGPARFGILLLEADEISAINFVDRLRAACREELGTGTGLGLRTGWASPGEAETLDTAVHRASARLGDPAFQGEG
jgi:diguanylate cyclase (GGDEF)-like protein